MWLSAAAVDRGCENMSRLSAATEKSCRGGRAVDRGIVAEAVRRAWLFITNGDHETRRDLPGSISVWCCHTCMFFVLASPPPSTASPSWSDQLSAWAAIATAVLTLAVVVMAVIGWNTAKSALSASKAASEAAADSARAATAANDQAKLDGIAQTRPYVYVAIVPSLVGQSCYDLKIANVGRTAARNLQLSTESWPDPMDDVATSVMNLFHTPRTLPPSCEIRAIWRLEGNFNDGTKEAGMGGSGEIEVRYTSDDPSHPEYTDTYEVQINNAGMWPVSEDGPEPTGLSGSELRFYKLGQALIRRVGELGR